MDSILKINNLNFKYKNSDCNILENFNLNIKKGEFVSILGASGSGKTTLLRILAGLEKVNLKSILNNSLKISYMPQNDSLLPWKNILENIVLPLDIQGVDKEPSLKKAKDLLKVLSLSQWGNSYPKELSGGMRQRISLVRTLISDADLLLLDEPFSALDSITKIFLREWLSEIILNLDKTFLFVTHDIDEAIYLSDRIIVIKNSPIKDFKEFHINKNLSNIDLNNLRNNILTTIKGEKYEK